VQRVQRSRNATAPPWLAATLGNMAAVNARTGEGFLGVRHRRIARRRGPQKAIVATGNTILTIVYHLLSNPTAQFHDLGTDYFTTRMDRNRRARSLAAALQAVTGQKITIHDGQAIIEAQAA
jgi:transposase